MCDADFRVWSCNTAFDQWNMCDVASNYFGETTRLSLHGGTCAMLAYCGIHEITQMSTLFFYRLFLDIFLQFCKFQRFVCPLRLVSWSKLATDRTVHHEWVQAKKNIDRLIVS